MITYTISMPEPDSHLFHVSIEVDGINGATQDLILPAWTPGSYMIREYARHVQDFSAQTVDGTPLIWQKVAKDTWRITTEGTTGLFARYAVYANELTVRTSHLDATHGYFNGASVFMYVAGRTNESLRLAVMPPHDWQVTTGLQPLMGDAIIADQERKASLFTAADYDELVDCPVECGSHRRLEFSVDNIAHVIAIWGEGNEDTQRLVEDTRRIVEVQRDFFGGLPYSSYHFILHLTDGRGGGLEHRNSVTNQIDRWSFRPERSYERYLALTSHEFFHVWNVKRLRPAPLGPFDYRSENYTRLLWLMEGATSYYDELLLVRAGLLQVERYLERLGEKIIQLQSQPGRLLQSLEQSSFDAWIKLYRPDEHSANSSISYYLKGALVCMLLDMQIRAASDGVRSLDDLMRLLYQRYPASGPGIPETGAVQAAAEEVTGVGPGSFGAFFQRYIAGVVELDYAAALAVVGLELRWLRNGPQAWLGLNVKRQGERCLVTSVRSDGPAYGAGIYAHDELVALDGWRISAAQLDARLAERQPGTTVRLTLFRGDQLYELPVTLGEAPADRAELVAVAQPSAQQVHNYQAWMSEVGSRQ
ncbi:MAG: M61 family peptidase [Candidatus Viridilinea halotolerans]|uniref:M61 family peptidase n=1 Tax=Candidatus Viridilinea halotolerans TaxID=2491704 RepID=A0A426U6D1_9CHLR|nr:MAG: M61 family peptidase [Candidatus Viridilinea halotolerans]